MPLPLGHLGQFGGHPGHVVETHHMATVPPQPPGASRHWLAWRRRHQALPAWYHHRTRLARDGKIVLLS